MEYRLSLSYSGDVSAQVGDDAAAIDLASGCFDLSDNFITVSRGDAFTPPVLGDQLRQLDVAAAQEVKSSLRLLLAPNPARSTVNLFYQLEGEVAETSELQIFNLTGQLVKRTQLPTAVGENNYRLDVSELPRGTYAVVFSNGKMIERQLLVKQ